MQVAIIASGKIGATLARRLIETGHEVTLANSCISSPGDDAGAKVRELADDIGFDTIDHGGLAAGRAQQPGSAVFGVPLSLARASGVS